MPSMIVSHCSTSGGTYTGLWKPYIALMSTGLTKANFKAAVDAARGRKGRQIQLRNQCEPGLRFRAGGRWAKWSLMVRLHTGERSRIAMPGLEARPTPRNARINSLAFGGPGARCARCDHAAFGSVAHRIPFPPIQRERCSQRPTVVAANGLYGLPAPGSTRRRRAGPSRPDGRSGTPWR